MKLVRLLLVALLALYSAVAAGASSAFAQGWSGDSRRIAMGGAGTSENLASRMVEEEGGYFVIPLPLGLFQVLKSRDIFDPDSDEFDLVRSIEYAASPLHLVANRDGTGTGVTLVNDLTNGQLSRDLNAYRGFVPVTQPVAYGLAAPNWGKTIRVYKSTTTTHGVYVGAGPYLSIRGELNVNEQLVDIFPAPRTCTC